MNRYLSHPGTPGLPARAAALLLCLASGQAAAAPAAAAGAALRPAVNYHNYCSVCHGDRGNGQSRAQASLYPPPRDFTTPDAAQLSRARLIEAISEGRPGTAMTAWKDQMSRQEIEELADYLRNTFMSAALNADGSRGRIVYSKNCAVCHGERGDGRSRAQHSLIPPPRNFTAPSARAELSEARMIASVTHGRADTAMAGFAHQLSRDDIRAVVSYIRNGFMAGHDVRGISGVSQARGYAAAPARPAAPAAAAPAPAPDFRAPMPNGLKGDIAKGAAFYMQNCATCHGTTGDGRGPRAYFIMPKPRNFLHPAAREQFNRPAVYKAVAEGKLGTEMPGWATVLSAQQIADVSEFVFQRFLQPGKAEVRGDKPK